jgi:hypothetical protein
MNQSEFIEKVKAMEIVNGTKFEVYTKDEAKIGTIGVIDSTIVYLDMPKVPNDLLIGDYIFKEIKEEK